PCAAATFPRREQPRCHRRAGGLGPHRGLLRGRQPLRRRQQGRERPADGDAPRRAGGGGAGHPGGGRHGGGAGALAGDHAAVRGRPPVRLRHRARAYQGRPVRRLYRRSGRGAGDRARPASAPELMRPMSPCEPPMRRLWPLSRRPARLLTQAALAAGLASALPLWAVAQTPSEVCRERWAAFEAGARSKSLEAASAAEKSLAATPGCGRERVAAKEAMLGLYRAEADRLKREGVPPAVQLAALEAALPYGNAWNAWDIHARIGDLRRRTPAADGQPDHSAVSLAYDEAVRAIDLAPPSARPAEAEVARLVGLAYQYEALSPT